MTLNLALQRRVDVLPAPVGLVLDPADQVEPLLQFLLVQAVVLALDGHHNVLELVHQDRKEGDAKDLDDTAENFLHDRDRAKVTIANGRQSRQRIVHTLAERLHITYRLAKMPLVRRPLQRH